MIKLRGLFATEPERARGARRRRAAADRGRDRASTTSPSATTPPSPVLRDVDLRIAPGETVAFVGPTGAGKSTLAKLVTRFYDPTAGRVLIDGHDIGEVTLDSLRRQLGVVPQEPFLFAGTIRDNIAFARPDATDDEVWEAVNAGRAHRGGRADARRPRHGRPRARASRCPRASASSSPWRGPSWPTPGCSCSTRPPPTSTCSPRPRSRRPSTCCSRPAHRGPDRPPPVHGHEGRPDRRGRRRPDARGRLARRAGRRAAAATPRCTRPGSAIWSSRRSPAVRLSSARKRRVAMTAGGLMFAAEGLAAPQLAETRAHTTGARSVPVHMHATWPGLNLES